MVWKGPRLCWVEPKSLWRPSMSGCQNLSTCWFLPFCESSYDYIYNAFLRSKVIEKHDNVNNFLKSKCCDEASFYCSYLQFLQWVHVSAAIRHRFLRTFALLTRLSLLQLICPVLNHSLSIIFVTYPHPLLLGFFGTPGNMWLQATSIAVVVCFCVRGIWFGCRQPASKDSVSPPEAKFSCE